MKKGKCEFCKANATGEVNGAKFCSKPKCINQAFGVAFKPLRAGKRYRLMLTIDELKTESAVHA